jgi:vesicular inhibitory amino acid transporter
MLGAETDPQSSLEQRTTSLSDGDGSKHVTQRILIGVERILFTLFAVGVSILVPDFSSAMAFLGSFSAFVICVIGPIAANIALTRRCTLFDAFLLVVATVMAIWGTVAAFSAI